MFSVGENVFLLTIFEGCRKLFQVLVQWVVFHTLVLIIVLKELLEVSMEPEKRVSRSAFLLILLEIGVLLWVSSVIWLQLRGG